MDFHKYLRSGTVDLPANINPAATLQKEAWEVNLVLTVTDKKGQIVGIGTTFTKIKCELRSQ